METKKLIVQPLISFAKLLGKDGDLESHERKQYHITAVQKCQDFLQCMKNSEHVVINRMDAERIGQAKENRLRLKPIIETVILCGRQNIPFRGHRDDGSITENVLQSNDGNFRNILRYRSMGDSILAKHLENSSSNATYISKTTQNEIINCCEEMILETIRKASKNQSFTL